MPKLVCVNCQTELEPETNGTVVIETASFGPYKVWNADTWKCPGCGIEVVAGFSSNPIRQDHYSKDFPKWLEDVKAKARRVEYDYERPVGRRSNKDGFDIESENVRTLRGDNTK